MLKNNVEKKVPLTILKPIVFLVILIIGVLFLMHFFAFFGLLLIPIYFYLYFFSPQFSFCFLCLTGKKKGSCIFCKEKQNDNKFSFSVCFVINVAIFLLLTLISFYTIHLIYKKIVNSNYLSTDSIMVLDVVADGDYKIDEVFSVTIKIEDIENPINTVQADLGFDSKLVEVVSVYTTDSFATVFIQNTINNEKGWVRLVGGLPNPGFFDSSGVFATVYFKSKDSGIGKISVLPSSLVLLNDGVGNNILTDFSSYWYSVSPERLAIAELQEQEKLTYTAGVLGVTVTNKLLFLDETPVLGASTEAEIEQNKKADLFLLFLNVLERINILLNAFFWNILRPN